MALELFVNGESAYPSAVGRPEDLCSFVGEEFLSITQTHVPAWRAQLEGLVGATCSGQLIPDTTLSFSSARAGASPPLN